MSDLKWVTVTKKLTANEFALPRFAHLGYPTKWMAGEKRNVPKDLRDKLAQNGIPLVEPDPDAKESVMPLPAVTWNGLVNLDALRKAYQDETRLECVMLEGGLRFGWRGGTFKAHFEDVLNYPLEWMKDEIREIPYSLYLALRRSGAQISAQPEDVFQARENTKAQALHTFRVEAWRKAKAEAVKAGQAQNVERLVAEAVKREEALAKAEAKNKLVERVKSRIGV